MNFPTYNTSSKTGETGFTIVKRIVERDLNWILRKNHQENDFGIDAYIDVISEFGQVTGKSIALQLKTGRSFFEEKTDFGWVYRGKLRHLNYYLNHDIPVVIIIVDEVLEKAYWSLCDGTKTERSGENWKITIPFNRELTGLSKKEFEKYISPVIDYASQLDDFWAINKLLKECPRIIFYVDREDVEQREYEDLLMGLKRLEVNPELLHACKGKIDILIHGYNNDPRELWEIPEVKEWYDRVFRGINGWVYYLVMDESAQFIRVLQLLNVSFRIIQRNVIREGGRRQNQVEIDPSTGGPFLNMLFMDLNIFCERHNISLDINKEVTYKLIEFLTGREFPSELKV